MKFLKNFKNFFLYIAVICIIEGGASHEIQFNLIHFMYNI